jgi:hypothetical protein
MIVVAEIRGVYSSPVLHTHSARPFGNAISMLIDAQVHLNDYHESTRRPTVENVKLLFEQMAAHKVDHAVVLTSYKAEHHR